MGPLSFYKIENSLRQGEPRPTGRQPTEGEWDQDDGGRKAKREGSIISMGDGLRSGVAVQPDQTGWPEKHGEGKYWVGRLDEGVLKW